MEIYQRKCLIWDTATQNHFGLVGRSSDDFAELREHVFREMLTKCLVSGKLVTQHRFIRQRQPSFSETSKFKNILEAESALVLIVALVSQDGKTLPNTDDRQTDRMNFRDRISLVSKLQ